MAWISAKSLRRCSAMEVRESTCGNRIRLICSGSKLKLQQAGKAWGSQLRLGT